MVRREAPDTVAMPAPARTAGTGHGEIGNAVADVLAETSAALGSVDHGAAVSVVDRIAGARATFVVGAGRSKLMVDAFAMRLMHLGYPAYVAADMTTPAITGPSEVLIVCSGSGETPTILTHARTARRAGAYLVAITATADSTLAALSDTVVELAETSGAGVRGGSVQFLGTLFEQCALLYLDALVLAMERLTDADRSRMLARHSNFE